MSREFNYIVRLHGSNLDGTKLLPYALCDIKGVGLRVAHTMVKQVGLKPQMRLGDLQESDVKKFEDILQTPALRGLPAWMFNRQKDPQTGEDMHIIASDLILQEKEDIELMGEMRSWKGFRHSRGLKVRGQRTKTTARKGRSVGVSRSRVQRQK